MPDNMWLTNALGLVSNLLANIITAGIVYIAIERERAKGEKRERDEQASRDKADRDRDSRNLINALLLEQFPPLVEHLQTVQRDAFRASMLCYSAMAPLHPYSIANEARHLANVHMNVKDTLGCMGVSAGNERDLAQFVNSLARVALYLARAEEPPGALWRLIGMLEKSIGESYDDEFQGSSHLERIAMLMSQTREDASAFRTMAVDDQTRFLCRLCELIGHITVLATEEVLKEFRRHVVSIAAVQSAA